ncbi:hypothetical protein BGP_4672 [Beggiatoa sp. PS]|nr:hypothetical protein BGP_4672 [Beggiatoa sp. PS]
MKKLTIEVLIRLFRQFVVLNLTTVKMGMRPLIDVGILIFLDFAAKLEIT